MLLRWLQLALLLSYGATRPTEQLPMIAVSSTNGDSGTPIQSVIKEKGLHGRFLHITDFHPDFFYQTHSSTEEDSACHRGNGPAGVFGAETTDCDSPTTLINATFRWIDERLKDTVDFVIWTGDGSRHDSDEQIPRSEEEVISTNEMLVTKFEEVWGKKDATNAINDFDIPIIPNFGNNDIMPHNIMQPGPNRWTQKYLSVWRKFIPEEQRHGFSTGGWFSVEVIPNHLTVFSLNTMYFFEHNTAVDGCAEESEPGYHQMEWLRIQLQFIRQRGMKAILMGHVPPARTEAKLLWDETCWQKYTLWLHQYRDIVVGSIYGHMNIDHFLLQDNKDVSDKALRARTPAVSREALDDEMTTQSTAEYLTDLRDGWSQIPDAPKTKSKSSSGSGYFYDFYKSITNVKRHKETNEEKYLEKIGGEWAERYSLSLISASVVPNYFPTLRVIEYNVSGIENLPVAHVDQPKINLQEAEDAHCPVQGEDEELIGTEKKSKKGTGRNQKPKDPQFKVPKPPSKSAPPGPAYSPQAFSWLGYEQYFANLTFINDDFGQDQLVGDERWHNGKHSGKKPHKDKFKHHNKFKYEVEYDTRNDSIFGLKDLTVRSYVDLAGRIGQYKSRENDWVEDVDARDREAIDHRTDVSRCGGDELETSKKKDKKHGKKHKHRKAINKVWFSFVSRAFVGTRDEDELRDDFG